MPGRPVAEIEIRWLAMMSLAWCSSFLTGRSQRVRAGSQISDVETLHASVPQGAMLSPLFFSLYINDITSSTDAEVNLFADDMSAYVTDKSPSGQQSKMQATVDCLLSWFNSWAITVNHAKSAVMVMTTQRKVPEVNTKIQDPSMPQIESHKHLGLLVEQRLSWSEHARHIQREVASKIGFLRHIHRRLHKLVIGSLYLSCINPTLEYASEA